MLGRDAKGGVKMTKYKWYYCDAIQGVEETYFKAAVELNKHTPFDLFEYKQETSWGWPNETTYFYSSKTDDETIQNDDGAYAPQIQEINEEVSNDKQN